MKRRKGTVEQESVVQRTRGEKGEPYYDDRALRVAAEGRRSGTGVRENM